MAHSIAMHKAELVYCLSSQSWNGDSVGAAAAAAAGGAGGWWLKLCQ